MNDDELERRLDLLAQITEIAQELGWQVAVPPDEQTEGLIIGNVNFIDRYNELLPEEDKLDIVTTDMYDENGKVLH